MNLKINLFHMIAIIVLLPTLLLAVETAPTDPESCPDISGLVIIGEAENVSFKPKDLRLNARIDTGAQTSSLGVLKLEHFERDGKKWVSFLIKSPDSNKSINFERPVQRTVLIKRHGAESIRRQVVTLKITLGGVEMEREFTLTDRSQFEFSVLIGRNVLRGKYLVDVNRRFLTKQTGGREE
jgi:hypothetical protein